MAQHFIDKHFQPQHAGKCDLLIEINPARISYAIVDQVNGHLQVLFNTSLLRKNGRIAMLDQLNELVNTKQELKFHFRKTKVSLQTFKFTFIPKELFNQSLIQEYTKFVNPDSVESDSVQVCDMKSLGIKSLIVLDQAIKTYTAQQFNRPLFFSQAHPFIVGIDKIITTEGIFLALNIQSETIECTVYNSEKLLFYNLFDCFNADELNYFLLYILNNLQINIKNCHVLLAGDIEKDNPYYQRIQKYFQNIHFVNTRQLLSQTSLTDELIPHMFFSLLCLDLCG